MKILINASNLHIGGGVQAAASIITEIAYRPELASQLSVISSDAVFNNISTPNITINKFKSFIKINTFGFKIKNKHKKLFNEYDVVLTIYGPLYMLSTNFINITGFAQAWITEPNNEVYLKLGVIEKIKSKFKFFIQKLFFKKSNALIAELEHVKSKIECAFKFDLEKIYVIHNCISSIYLDKNKWNNISIKKKINYINLGFVGRNYVHKNTEIFPKIFKILGEKYNINSVFYVTFTNEEWISCPDDFRFCCINVGPLNANECPSFYREMDAVIFPSLLECFSATPLEALAMKKPLFASDRAFNRDVCGEHAHYFDPLSAESAARVIAEYFNSTEDRSDAIDKAREHALNFSNAKERAEKYLAILFPDHAEQLTANHRIKL